MNQKKILLFEDDAGQALLTQEELEKHHLAVDVAPNVSAGIELFLKNHYDVVLLDLVMPDMTGIEVFHQLNQLAPGVVGIVVTGSGDERAAVEALKSGVSDYIVKASNAAHLATLPTVIEHALEHGALKREKERLQAELKDYAATLEKKVSERTRELQKVCFQLEEKTKHLEKFQRFTVGRELDMIRLKKEVNELLEKMGKSKKYDTPDRVKE